MDHMSLGKTVGAAAVALRVCICCENVKICKGLGLVVEGIPVKTDDEDSRMSG